jgi:phenylacetate-CoA ligase
MLIVRGVNVFPSALREVVNRFAPAVTGVISVRPSRKGFRQDPPLKVVVEAAQVDDEAAGATAAGAANDLAERIRADIRATLLVTTEIVLVAPGTLPRSEYKSKLVDWREAV